MAVTTFGEDFSSLTTLLRRFQLYNEFTTKVKGKMVKSFAVRPQGMETIVASSFS